MPIREHVCPAGHVIERLYASWEPVPEYIICRAPRTPGATEPCGLTSIRRVLSVSQPPHSGTYSSDRAT